MQSTATIVLLAILIVKLVPWNLTDALLVMMDLGSLATNAQAYTQLCINISSTFLMPRSWKTLSLRDYCKLFLTKLQSM